MCMTTYKVDRKRTKLGLINEAGYGFGDVYYTVVLWDPLFSQRFFMCFCAVVVAEVCKQ